MKPSSWNAEPRSRGQVTSLVAMVLLSGCTSRGVVGITSTRNFERDAMPALADASDPTDVSIRTDGRTSHVVAIDDCGPNNPANLDPGGTAQLVDGVGDASSMRFLYPYDGTVYPQGIPGPVLMWDGPAPDAVYVRLHSRTFDYQGCLKPTGPNRLDLPSGVWDLTMASANGAPDPFTLDLKVLAGGAVHGPISEQLVILTSPLKGSVYYMTTTAQLAVPGILRVRGGRAAEPVLTPLSCSGCHSVAANGTRLLAFSSGVGASFDVSASSLTLLLAPTPGAEFSAVYPDGSVYVASAHPTSGGPRSYGGGLTAAGLYDAPTGTLVANSGIPSGACMPAFSPDGEQLSFTDFGASSGHTLASMSFSIATRVASGYQVLYSAGDGFVGWPAFLPGSTGIVFTQGAAADFSGQAAGLVPVLTGPSTDLFITDNATHNATLLSQAMGFRSADDAEAGLTYLPGGTLDLHQNYYPTVSPVPAAGYAWVLFDSVRSYGNQGVRRAIWGTAISLSSDGRYGADPSHPAFYLPGQGANTPNFRAVAVMDL